jgi:kinesin family protein 2/24
LVTKLLTPVVNTIIDVTSAQELYELINGAMKMRNTQATGVNSQSSRSHCIIRIFLKLRSSGKIYGQLTLVDLAGSERNADSFYHTAERRRECSQINYSLMTLKDCIRIRAENLKNGTKKHIPYRSSKLSHFLKECFSTKRNSRTVVISTFSPIPTDTEHTMNTLQHTCMMLMKKDAEMSKLTVREVLNYKSKEKPAPIPLQQWTGDQCRTWLSTVDKMRYKKYVDRFPSQLDGRQLVRLTAKRFAQIGGDEIDKVNAHKAERLKSNKQFLRGKNI